MRQKKHLHTIPAGRQVQHVGQRQDVVLIPTGLTASCWPGILRLFLLRFIPASAGNRTVTGIPEWLKTDHPREVIEAALAHGVRNRVKAANAHSDLFERRRVLMDEWARYLAQRSGEDPEPLEKGGRRQVLPTPSLARRPPPGQAKVRSMIQGPGRGRYDDSA